MKQIIVQSLVSSTQTAVIKGNKLVELLIEDNIHKKTKSNIYRGIVKNIKPGIEAAFVDIGFEKMAYLPIKSSDNIKNGMEVLVQINKEGVGTKAPKLTQEISLSGRYLVLIPSNDRITISNKILEEKERFRLKKIVKSFNKEKLGIIIRTEAVNCDIDKLKEDFDLLIKRYQEILKQFKLGIGPKLLYRELDLDTKYIKDNINEDIDKIVINDKTKYDEIKSILSNINKDYIQKLVLEENKDVKDLCAKACEDNNKTEIKFGGSTSVEKISKALTEAFATYCPSFKPTHNHTGSGTAFKGTQGSEKDGVNSMHIGFLSRELSSSETALEGSHGLICKDGIVVVVNAKNNLVSNLTTEQVKTIYSQDTTKWSDIIAK